MEQSRFGAFIKDDMNIEPAGSGILDHLHFAVKDVFAVQGHTNSAGNPEWKKTHQPAVKNAWTIDRLLGNGATLRGMTVTDELMYSLKGDNVHFPPTINPRLPDCFSGGSSSGSAVAVAGWLTDFAIGTDTGGSIRIPSSYCGLFGMRPTHGVISLDGVIPLAPSYDTVGWMAENAEILEAVGKCLLPGQEMRPFRHFYKLRETWKLLTSASVTSILRRAVSRIFQDSPVQDCPLPYSTLPELVETFRMIQSWEAWQLHGRWIEENDPQFAPDIAGRFEAASKIKQDEAYQRAVEIKARFGREMSTFLGQDGLLILPTTYGSAPKRSASVEEAEKVRAQTMKLTCIAGVSGLPQITVPLIDHDHPVGLSFISGRGTDRQLLTFVRNISEKTSKS